LKGIEKMEDEPGERPIINFVGSLFVMPELNYLKIHILVNSTFAAQNRQVCLDIIGQT